MYPKCMYSIVHTTDFNLYLNTIVYLLFTLAKCRQRSVARKMRINQNRQLFNDYDFFFPKNCDIGKLPEPQHC